MATLIDKYSIEKMIDRYQKELDQLFMEQESLKVGKKSSKLKAQGGIKVPDPNEELNAIQEAQDEFYKAGNYNKPVIKPVMQTQPVGDIYNQQLNALKSNPYIGETNLGAMNQHLNSLTPQFGKYGTTLGSASLVDNKLAGKPNVQTTPEKTDWNNIGNIAMQMASPAYNIVKGLLKPARTKPIYNPYNDYIMSLMNNRRFNIDTLLTQNRTAQAIADRNIRNTAMSRGELMGNLGAAQNNRMAGDMSAWAQKNNMDNQYMAEQAQMAYGLGRDQSEMLWNTQLANQQNRAMRNQFLGQGMLDLSNYSQMQQLMANQTERDRMLLKIYPDMFKTTMPFMSGIQSIINQMGVNRT